MVETGHETAPQDRESSPWQSRREPLARSASAAEAVGGGAAETAALREEIPGPAAFAFGVGAGLAAQAAGRPPLSPRPRRVTVRRGRPGDVKANKSSRSHHGGRPTGGGSRREGVRHQCDPPTPVVSAQVDDAPDGGLGAPSRRKEKGAPIRPRDTSARRRDSVASRSDARVPFSWEAGRPRRDSRRRSVLRAHAWCGRGRRPHARRSRSRARVGQPERLGADRRFSGRPFTIADRPWTSSGRGLVWRAAACGTRRNEKAASGARPPSRVHEAAMRTATTAWLHGGAGFMRDPRREISCVMQTDRPAATAEHAISRRCRRGRHRSRLASPARTCGEREEASRDRVFTQRGCARESEGRPGSANTSWPPARRLKSHPGSSFPNIRCATRRAPTRCARPASRETREESARPAAKGRGANLSRSPRGARVGRRRLLLCPPGPGPADPRPARRRRSTAGFFGVRQTRAPLGARTARTEPTPAATSGHPTTAGRRCTGPNGRKGFITNGARV
jgi:hypothetical protein